MSAAAGEGGPEGTRGGEPPSLRAAIRTARIEDAERERALASLRDAELARLDLLREALGPVLAQVPAGVDLFDVALSPVPQPRLFVDMIGFVEMAPDRRTFRLMQDTRHGRVTLAESASPEAMRDAVTAYMARRLVEREKALAGSSSTVPTPAPVPEPAGPGPLRRAGRLALEYLGIVSLVVLAWVLGAALYQWWVAAHRP